ncbi:MAG: methylated-DNA--[protein]-cysteine S-methyltransferase [Bacteriovoracales bacterium]|nr:methylated-DNA--[protein]-cysteine S-methyltransferase [Bacteriovoracales bacterium]
MERFKGSFPTPIGVMTVTLESEKIVEIQFGGHATKRRQGPTLYHKACEQIVEYAHGQRRHFELPFSLRGTPFQKKVWKAMARIPFGKRCSYKDLARIVGSPKAFRAVGGACHRNPLPLIIPCHRVVGADGALTGFAGGIGLKKRLLRLEE